MKRALPALFLTWTCLSAARAQPVASRWQAWPPIDKAIAIEPLDGPDELLEKAEIIADRRDGLMRELTMLSHSCASVEVALAGVLTQAETLRELASRNRRKVMLRQRQHALRGRQRELETASQKCVFQHHELTQALTAETTRHQRYLDHASRLRAEETQRP